MSDQPDLSRFVQRKNVPKKMTYYTTSFSNIVFGRNAFIFCRHSGIHQKMSGKATKSSEIIGSRHYLKICINCLSSYIIFNAVLPFPEKILREKISFSFDMNTFCQKADFLLPFSNRLLLRNGSFFQKVTFHMANVKRVVL